MFFWNSLAFSVIQQMLALWSDSSTFSKTSLNIWKFIVHELLKPGLENFEHYFTSVWDECNCAVVWAFFGIAFLWDWNENWPFPVLWPLLFQQHKKRLHMDITRWSTPKSDWLYSFQPKMEKRYTVSKNKTRSWLWLRSWTSYCQIQTEIKDSGENH